ncbi:glutathione peroxidase [Henriciella sp. AS95]|uniref:glutathione peroxidase n=1 Tax=Henriciella sp. AS95 TaxID=3135782 RepID=UPI00317D363E
MLRPALFAIFALTACSGAAQSADDGEANASTSEISETDQMTANVHDVAFKSIDGKDMPLADFEGEVLLVVNTASKCGYTPQYEGLQALHDRFEQQGFTVVGAPSNDFGGQEPGTEEEIKTFCEINFGVDFPLTSKVHAIGPEQHEFWQVAKTGLGEAAEPKWNFHKVLVSKSGDVLKAYPSSVKPGDEILVADIENALAN